MIVDTDVLIWALRGNGRAVSAIDRADVLAVSIVTYMELIQGARDKRDLRTTRDYLSKLKISILPLTENVGHRASIYVEEFALKSQLGIPDALIAATAVECDLPLCTGNAKHYRPISELSVKVFRPS